MGKRLTNREKQHHKEIKKELQEAGVLSPDKPRLNRKKFIDEAKAAWDDRDKEFPFWETLIINASSYVMAHPARKGKGMTLEAVGVAKVFMVALRIQEFQSKLEQQGKIYYNKFDEYDFIKDILEK